MTATYTKPTKTPRWADTLVEGIGNILEPTETKKDLGWVFEEIPPSPFENWRTQLVGNWIKWINERVFDGTTNNELLLKSPGSAVSALRIADTVVTSELPLTVKTSGTARLSVGATLADFSALDVRTTGKFQFTANDYIKSNGGPGALWTEFWVNGGYEFAVTSTGCQIRKGLQVGSFIASVIDNEIHADGIIQAGGALKGTDVNLTSATGCCLPQGNGVAAQQVGSSGHAWGMGYINSLYASNIWTTNLGNLAAPLATIYTNMFSLPEVPLSVWGMSPGEITRITIKGEWTSALSANMSLTTNWLNVKFGNGFDVSQYYIPMYSYVP